MTSTAMPIPHHLPTPGMLWGDYPERRADGATSGWSARIDRAWTTFRAVTPGLHGACRRRFALRVAAQAATLANADPDDWARRLHALRAALARHGLDEDRLLEAFALVTVACERALRLRPFDTQIAAARVMLDNRLAEMATGEGKTVAVALAAAVAALAGTPVHVVTANDYLAARDAQAMGEFYRACGLSSAAVTQTMDSAARRAAYAADIAYCTASELAFDYLRDSLTRPRGLSDLGRRARRLGGNDSTATGTVLRGLCMAIIDEADTVLIDEARMPLVLSQAEDETDGPGFLAAALDLARTLRSDTDYALPGGQRGVVLTAAGTDKIAAWPATPGAYAGNRRHRENTVCLALAALHLYERDRDYVVRDARILIVDDNTGRTAPGRAWSRGLQQLIELKEHCAPSRRFATIAQITFQRFFRRYVRLAGMSGTLRGAEHELAAVYALAVVRIAPRQPSRRLRHALQWHRDRAALWQAVARRAAEVHSSGQPILIGTASVAESEQLSRALAAAGLAHAVLNARQDQAEADVVAHAGDAGRITVATSMAGRGTDIRLGAGVAGRGGLHVILCQHNGARRIDRQFIGRAARNGEPGSVDTLLSLDSPPCARWLPDWWLRLARHGAGLPAWFAPAWFARLTAALPQWLEERHQCTQRRALCRLDAQREQDLAFCQRTSS